MSRRPARFTQAEIARAIRAAAVADSGLAVEILADGTIRIRRAPPGGFDQGGGPFDTSPPRVF
jgi:hypothetical protein